MSDLRTDHDDVSTGIRLWARQIDATIAWESVDAWGGRVRGWIRADGRRAIEHSSYSVFEGIDGFATSWEARRPYGGPTP